MPRNNLSFTSSSENSAAAIYSKNGIIPLRTLLR